MRRDLRLELLTKSTADKDLEFKMDGLLVLYSSQLEIAKVADDQKNGQSVSADSWTIHDTFSTT